MNKISDFLSENFQFLVVKFSIYLNRQVFVMLRPVYLKRNIDKQCIPRLDAENAASDQGQHCLH